MLVKTLEVIIIIENSVIKNRFLNGRIDVYIYRIDISFALISSTDNTTFSPIEIFINPVHYFGVVTL